MYILYLPAVFREATAELQRAAKVVTVPHNARTVQTDAVMQRSGRCGHLDRWYAVPE